jgi:hypothetical protein
MRLYDIVVLVTPDLSDEDASKLAGEYKKILTDGGATVVKEEPWAGRLAPHRPQARPTTSTGRTPRGGGRGRAPHGPLGPAWHRRARRRGAQARR